MHKEAAGTDIFSLSASCRQICANFPLSSLSRESNRLREKFFCAGGTYFHSRSFDSRYYYYYYIATVIFREKNARDAYEEWFEVLKYDSKYFSQTLRIRKENRVDARRCNGGGILRRKDEIMAVQQIWRGNCRISTVRWVVSFENNTGANCTMRNLLKNVRISRIFLTLSTILSSILSL